MTLATLFFQSDLGWIRIIANQNSVTRIDFAEPETAQKTDASAAANPHLQAANSHLQAANLHLQAAKQQLQEYFAGVRTQFNLPLAPEGTPFQQAVWTALTTIPYGATCSYKHIAELVDRPKGSQAIGQANSKNPISIVIPCHRVVGSNGKLTGYAGGLDRKAALLQREKQTALTTITSQSIGA